MDSGSKNDESDAATKHVLEYYKKYSQNKELSKYFSGTSVNYLPVIKDEIVDNPVIVPMINIEKEASDVQQSIDTSRASSAMSNRKLEWDNGADIGYENLRDVKVLRKSISLPVITDIKDSDQNFNVEQIVSCIDHAKSEGSSDSNVQVILLTFSSSSEDQNQEIDDVHSSSSSYPEKRIPSYSSSTDTPVLSKHTGITSPTSEGSSNEKIVKFVSPLSYLKRKIGLPGAHSTPKYLEARKSDPELFSNTLVAHKLEKNPELNHDGKSDVASKPSSGVTAILPGIEQKKEVNQNKKYINDRDGHVLTYKNSKIVNLALTKPITVECMCSPKTEKVLKEVRKHASVGIQTDTISEKELTRIIRRSEADNKNQSLICFEYPDSDKTHCGTQTSSDIASRCDSFEYYKNSGGKVMTLSSGSQQNEKPTDNITLITDKQTADLGTKESHQFSSNDICLGDVISASHLNNMEYSVEKNICLLHKLLKSKKYDAVTKKRYIKKIMEKMTESKYFEESSNSSDLFRPKKSNVTDIQPPKTLSTDTSDERPQKSMPVNLPLYLPVNEKNKISPRKRKLGIKTFIQDFLPNQNQSSHEETNSLPEIIPSELKDTKKNCFTLTNNEFSAKRECSNSKNKSDNIAAYKVFDEPNASLEKQYEVSSTKTVNYQNWKEDKTASEKLLEENSGTTYGEGDCLVKFAEKEREYQISWINNEISHLGKLKGLLEKPVGLSKFNEQLQNIKKTTTVYTVSEELDQPATKGVTFKRNYVIETNLGADSTIPVSFKLQGKKYSVTDLATKNPDRKKTAGGIIGDIEVVSSDSVTSIKISAFCESCRRSPCACACSKCKRIPCNCTVAKPAVCQVCYTIPCICHTTRSDTHHAHCLLDQNHCWKCNKSPCQCASPSTASTLSGKTICLICHRRPCVCVRKSSEKGTLSKTCVSCGKYPCIYGKSRTSTVSDEYAGTFIVACPPKSAIEGGIKNKFSTFPLTSKEENERRYHANKDVNTKRLLSSTKLHGSCLICGIFPCICDNSIKLTKVCTICEKSPCTCETRNTKLNKKCSVCGKSPCFCETIRREYLSRSTTISEKLLDKCTLCREYPCICRTTKTGTKKCSVCGKQVCECDTIKRNYLTRSTSISAKSLENCSLCGKCPCICDLLKKQLIGTSTSTSLKSLELCSVCGKYPCICAADLKSVLPVNTCADSPTESLKRVFENCNCSTQTNCTCDFVEKLIERFNKANVARSVSLKDCRSNGLQTEDKTKCDCQHVGVQTKVDAKHQILQTPCALNEASDNKVSQTERCCQTIAIQTTETEVVSCGEEEKKKGVSFSTKIMAESLCQCEGKVDVGCACESTQGTQTLGQKRVVLTCSSQSDGSRTVSPAERTYSHTYSDGISHLKKHKKSANSSNKYCACPGHHKKVRPNTSVATKEYESKIESLDSDIKYVTSKSSSVITSYNETMESASDPLSSKDSLTTCICCKEKYPPEKISMLGSANQNFPLCTHCLQRRPILTSLCYAGPEHECTCYKPVKKDVLRGVKTPANELYDLEYCTCTTPSQAKNSQYCTHCQMRLRNTARTKSGIAYTLTLEDKRPPKVKSKRKKKKSSLEEIRIRVPCPYARKEHKDRVNLCKQDGDNEGVAVGYVERITTDSDYKKCPRVKVICSKTKRSRKSNLTLQDYLKRNKPDFIDSAENRRQTLFNSKSERELVKDEAKIRFFEDNKCHCDKLKKQNTKLFTEQEMKAITRRNYAKLPEVLEKNNAQREKRLRNADKFIVDVFSTKIRKCALKGKKDFPLSQNIVSLPKT